MRIFLTPNGVAGAMILSVALTTGAHAQPQQSEDQFQNPRSPSLSQDTSSSQTWASRSDSSPGEEQTIRGTVDTVRQARWQFRNGRHESRQIARLKLEDGRTEFVDLGSKPLPDLNLEPGQQVQMRGHFRNIRGRHVFMADQIQVNGQTFAIQRNQGNEQNQNQFAQESHAQPNRTVHGTIEGFRHIYLRSTQGQREQHSLVKLRLQDGRSLVADLGPKQPLDELNLEQGETITLRGHRGTEDGRPVFFADQIRAGGQTVQINRGRQGQLFGQRGQTGGEFTLRGKVAGYQVITLESGQRQVSFLNLRLQNGQSVLIDAGSNRSQLDLQDLAVRDRVIIQGHTKDVNGHEVLVADNVQFEPPAGSQGQQSAVGRPGQEQQSSGQSSSGWQNQLSPEPPTYDDHSQSEQWNEQPSGTGGEPNQEASGSQSAGPEEE